MWLWLLLLLQENIPIEEVFEQLKCTREGLSSEEGNRRIEMFGPNKLEEKKVRAMLCQSLLHSLCCVWFSFISDANRSSLLRLFVCVLVQESKILKFLGFMWNPLSWVMEMAAIMAIALANGGGKPPDWEDFVGIIVLLVINSTISFIEENNAGNAAAALMANLAPKTKVSSRNTG